MPKQPEFRSDVEHFNQWAGQYEKSGLQRYIGEIHEAMLEQVGAEAGSPGSVVDIGCGTGRLLRRVAQQWPDARFIGVDPADGMVTVAQQFGSGAEFIVAPAESMPIPSDSVGLAFSTISFHHWADQRRGLQEAARVLRPGGLLCLADIAMPRWLARILRSKAQSAKTLPRLVAQAGFEVVNQRRILANVILIVTARKRATAA